MDPGITSYGWAPIIAVSMAGAGAYRWTRRKIGKDVIHTALSIRAARGQPLNKEQLELFMGGVRAVCKEGHMRYSRKLVAKLLIDDVDVWTFARRQGVEL